MEAREVGDRSNQPQSSLLMGGRFKRKGKESVILEISTVIFPLVHHQPLEPKWSTQGTNVRVAGQSQLQISGQAIGLVPKIIVRDSDPNHTEPSVLACPVMVGSRELCFELSLARSFFHRFSINASIALSPPSLVHPIPTYSFLIFLTFLVEYLVLSSTFLLSHHCPDLLSQVAS